MSNTNVSKSTAKNLFAQQELLAQNLLTNYRGKIVGVRKASRSGATFSLVKIACNNNQKTVIIMPYKKDFKTIETAATSAITPKNPKVVKLKSIPEMCKIVEVRIKQNHNRKKLPFHRLGDCVNCSHKIGCPLQEVLLGDWNVLCTTYAKLKALFCSSSTASQTIRALIITCDNIIMDDFVTGLLSRLPHATLKNKLKLSDYLEKEFNFSQTILEATTPQEKLFWSSLQALAEIIDQQTSTLLDSDSRIIENPLSNTDRKMLEDNFFVNYSIVEKLVDKDIKLLLEIMALFNSKLIQAQHSEKRDKKQTLIEESTVLTPWAKKEWAYSLNTTGYLTQTIYSFAQDCGKMKKAILPTKMVLIVDSSLPSDPLFLANVTGIALYRILPEMFVWGDPLQTNKKQMVICDSKEIGQKRFMLNDETKVELVSEIKDLSLLHGADTVVLCCLNKDVYDCFDLWQNSIKSPKKMKIPNEITLTHYHVIRSKIQPEPKRNVLILAGTFIIPKAADVLETKDPRNRGLSAFSKDEKDLASEIKQLKRKSLFVNALSVIKDPTGQNISYVYALGVTKEQAQKWLYDKDFPTPIVETFPAKGAKAGDFRLAGEILLNKTSTSISLEDALILTRVISRVKRCGKLPVRKIIQKCNTKRIRELVEANRKLLESFGLTFNYSRNGGLSLSYTKI